MAPTVASTALANQSCGTEVHRKPDGTKWFCAFADNFNGTKLNTVTWRVMTSAEFDFGRREDCFVNSPSNIYVGYGILTLSGRRVSKPVTCSAGSTKYQTQYTAGMVSTYGKWAQKYGRFEFRARFPYTTQRGVQTSLWLWPAAGGTMWPVSGEIDIAEWYSHYPDRVIPYLHYGTGFLTPGQTTNNNCLVKNVGSWHRYLMVWSPKAITISYDGKVCLHNTSTDSAFDKRYIMSMFQGFGLEKNTPTSSTPALNKGQFDWVRVWY